MEHVRSMCLGAGVRVPVSPVPATERSLPVRLPGSDINDPARGIPDDPLAGGHPGASCSLETPGESRDLVVGIVDGDVLLLPGTFHGGDEVFPDPRHPAAIFLGEFNTFAGKDDCARNSGDTVVIRALGAGAVAGMGGDQDKAFGDVADSFPGTFPIPVDVLVLSGSGQRRQKQEAGANRQTSPS